MPTMTDYSQGRHNGIAIGLPLASVTQEHLHTAEMPGDCMRAALASLLGLSRADVPHFVRYGMGEPPPDDYGWWWAFVGFCAELEPSVDVLVVDSPPEPSESVDDVFGCYLAAGKASRGLPHVVVGRGGQTIWDPHPSRAGLIGDPTSIYRLVRRATA
jgi:hypothetical protein